MTGDDIQLRHEVLADTCAGERLTLRVEDIMTRDPLSIHAQTTLKAAAVLMFQHGISALPVLSSFGELVGMITEGDLLRSKLVGIVRRADVLRTVLMRDVAPLSASAAEHTVHGRRVFDQMA